MSIKPVFTVLLAAVFFVIPITFYDAGFNLYFSVLKCFLFIKVSHICILGKFCKHTLNAFVQVDKMFESEFNIVFYKMLLGTSVNVDKNPRPFFEHTVQLSTV